MIRVLSLGVFGASGFRSVRVEGGSHPQKGVGARKDSDSRWRGLSCELSPGSCAISCPSSRHLHGHRHPGSAGSQRGALIRSYPHLPNYKTLPLKSLTVAQLENVDGGGQKQVATTHAKAILRARAILFMEEILHHHKSLKC